VELDLLGERWHRCVELLLWLRARLYRVRGELRRMRVLGLLFLWLLRGRPRLLILNNLLVLLSRVRLLLLLIIVLLLLIAVLSLVLNVDVVRLKIDSVLLVIVLRLILLVHHFRPQ